MSPWLAVGMLVALSNVGAPACAGWLSDEWRSYRSFPRMNEAYRLYKDQRYAPAREYVEQVERIDPDNRDAAVLKFSICEGQQDYACIRDLGQLWQARKPEDGLGTAMLAYIAYIEARHADLVELAPAALRLAGLRPSVRRQLGQVWVDALLGLQRFDEASAAVAWLDANRVGIADRDRKTWQQALVKRPAPVSQAPPFPGAPAPGKAAAPPAATAPAPGTAAAPQARGTGRAAPAAQPAPRPRPPPVAAAAPRPQPAAPPPAPPPSLPTAESEVLPLIEAARYAEAVARLQELQAAGRLSPQTRENLVLSLQGRDCVSVLQLVPANATAPLTTARQQLAAGYCATVDATRAARHFEAARTLAAGDAALTAQALGGQADSLVRLGDATGARAALAEAVRLAPRDAQLRASYGYSLKAAGAEPEALSQFETAWQLDSQRTELLPEMALLAQRTERREESIRFGRAAIDEYPSISRRQNLSEEETQRRLFGWRREVQTQEDRFSWNATTNVRLDHGPDSNVPLSPIDYAQYGGSLNLGASYRYTPLGALLPTWAFARAAQGLQDRSLALEPENQLLGVGVRQRLSQRYLIVGSAEYLWRRSAEHSDDVMLRLSGSNTWSGDWDPVNSGWVYANVFADLAWVVRAHSYYATLSGEWGWQHKLQDAPFKATVIPYLAGGYAASNDSLARTDVNRVDVGLGLAFQTWHREDKYRAPDLSQRLSLEMRRVLGGNTTDRHTVQLRWTISH